VPDIADLLGRNLLVCAVSLELCIACNRLFGDIAATHFPFAVAET
jgi:hypothetical protein